MKIGIFDPYLDTLGGGERYVLTIAACLAQDNEVFLFWDDNSILEKSAVRFNLGDLSRVKITKNIFATKENIFQRRSSTKEYDVIFFMSDGSIPLLFAPKNILIFQHPVNWVRKLSFKNKIKLRNIKKVIVYSQFTKSYIDKTFGISSVVLYPSIENADAFGIEKENILLTVGRFTRGMNTKKQEVLIDTFKKIYDAGIHNWKFVIIGSYLPGDAQYVADLQKETAGYPIKILANASHKELVSFYEKAKIYWHGAGFGENLEQNPERVEHFGISTVEAMTHGAVPVVINAGGQKEIVTDGKDGYLWGTLSQLKKNTIFLIKNPKKLDQLAKNGAETARQYNTDRFCKEIIQIIQ